MAPTQDQTHILAILEDTATLLRKTQANLKKCPKARLTKGYIEARINIIDDYWHTFKSTHHDLVKITPKELKGALPYFLNEEFFTYEDLYNIIQGELKDMLSACKKPINDSSSASTSAHQQTSSKQNVHLPKIQLPTFTGQYEDWPTYKDLFWSLVHNNESLSGVQKLHYLKTSITGEASTLLRHINVTESNYMIAWNILKNRYGNRRLIVNSLLKRLFSLRKTQNNIQSAQHLKHLLDQTSEVISSLNNQNIATDSWDHILIFLVVQKLDQDSHKQWEDFAHKDDVEELPKWDDLKKILEANFRTLELVGPTTAREKTSREKVFHVTSKTKICVKCKGDHTLSHCQDFSKLSLEDRASYVKGNNICFNCLSVGHSASHCRVQRFCLKCHKRHHSLLHQSTKFMSSKDSNGENVEVNTKIVPITSTPLSVALLATALVKISDDYGHYTVVKALVDTGSQASFVSERAVQTLNVNRRKINGTITGIGSSRTNVNQSTELYVSPRHTETVKMKTKTYIMQTRLTSRLPTTTISTNTWPHLEGLILADPTFTQPGRVDMLLGVDVCAQIMVGEIIKGPPGTPALIIPAWVGSSLEACKIIFKEMRS